MNKAFLVSAAVLLLAGIAFAQTDPGDFLGSTSDAVIKFFAELSRRLIFTGMVWTKINEIKYEVYNNLPDYLLKNPDLGDAEVLGLVGYFLRIIQPLYVTAITLTGIYLLFFSGTPEGRSRAKDTLVKLVVGIVLVTLFLPILQILFSFSNTLTKNILAQGPYDSGFTYRRAVDYLTYRAVDFMWGDIALGLPFLILSLAVTTGLFLMLAAREFILIFLIVFFPVALFLYLFNLTKNIGGIFLKQLVFWLFLPVGYALVLVTVSVSSQSLMFSMIELTDIVGLTAGLLLLLSPLVMYAVVDWAVKVFITTIVIIEPGTHLGGTKQRQKTEESAQAAVGVRGYKRVEKKKKEKTQETALGAVGAKGYRRIERLLSGTGFGSSKKGDEEARITKTKKSLIPMSLMSRIMADEEERGKLIKDSYAEEKSGKKKSIYEEYEEEERGEKHVGKGVGPSMHLAQHKEPPKKDAASSIGNVGIKQKWTKATLIEIAPGESGYFTIKIVNDDSVTYYRVSMYEDGLSDVGFDVSYSQPKFSLNPGEEKEVKVKVTSPEGMDKGVYQGTINFKTEKSIIGTVELTIQVGEKKMKVFEGVDDSDIGFSRIAKEEEAGEEETVVEKVNIFGEKETLKLGADSKSSKGKPKERTVSAPSMIKSTPKQPEKEHSRAEAAQKNLELMKPVMSTKKMLKKLRLMKPRKKDK